MCEESCRLQLFASLTYAYLYPIELIEKNLWILKEHNNFSCLWKFELDIPNGFGEILLNILEILQRTYGSLTFLPPSNFAVFDRWYFLHSYLQKAENCTNCSSQSAFSTSEFSSYATDGFSELSCMHVNEENVNNDVSKDSPIVSLTLTNFNSTIKSYFN